MPAIKFLNGSTTHIVSQYRDFKISRIHTYPSSGKLVIPQWYGFVCNAGAIHLKGGKISRLCVEAVSAGDGSIEDEWVLIPKGHFALGWWIPSGNHITDAGDLYGLVDDFGWPMTTLRYNDKLCLSV